MSDVRTVSAIIRGRVQGVSYRAWTKEKAQGLGLSGHVRNRSDGSVEALFSGPAEAVDRMLVLCRKGPLLSRVDGLSVTEDAVAPAGPGFTVERG